MSAGLRLRRVGIVGAGLAGASCARALAQAGCEVQVFDKSRGVGGRMATRRASVTIQPDAAAAQTVCFDHGVPAWTARTPEFISLLSDAAAAGQVQRWTPRLRSVATGTTDRTPLWVGQPDMPALARWLLTGLPVHTGCTVTALSREGQYWALHSAEAQVAEALDAVVVAIPPQQAAVLWATHRPQWAVPARAQAMSPCWTLMALTDEPAAAAARRDDWDVLLPEAAPLARVIRQDSKPGRSRIAGLAQWVVHADAAWSRSELESEPVQVQGRLQAALERALGAQLRWHYAVVHRWRYAQPQASQVGESAPAWDPIGGIGACGDYLGPCGADDGVEAAWRDGRALARAMVG